MDSFQALDPTTRNLIVIGAEVLAVIVLFTVLGWLLGRLLAMFSGVKGLGGGIALVRRNLRFLLILVGFLGCLGVAGFDAWLMVRGADVLVWQGERLAEVPSEFWVSLGVGAAQGLGLVLLAWYGLRWVRRGIEALARRAKDFDQIKANDASIQQFFASLTTLLARATWIAVCAVIAGWVGLPESAQAWLWILLRVWLLVAGGLLVARALDAMVDSLDTWSRRYARPDNWFAHYEKLAHLVPLARRALEFAVYVLVATLVVRQVEAIADLAEWGERLIQVIAIGFLARVAVELVNLAVDELMLKRPKLAPEQLRRRSTVVPLVCSGAKYIVYFGAGIVSLEVLGIDSKAVLGAAGIFSLAVGLASQDLIRDIVSGFFILFEDDFLVGDYVEMGGAVGVVEEIDLRTTCVRDNEGRVHILRNGQIENVINYSKRYVNAVVDVGVAYESDLRAVFAAFEAAGRRLAAECDQTLAPLELRGLQAFGESELTLRAVVRAKPGKHLEVQFALRRILWEVFEQRGIEIPYARRVVIFRPEAGGEAADGASAASGPAAPTPVSSA